jgi:hypothetical protein
MSDDERQDVRGDSTQRQSPEPDEEAEGVEYPPLLDYLQSKEGHELASRILAIFEDIKKATIDRAAEQHKLTVQSQHKVTVEGQRLVFLVFIITIGAAALLAWHGKLDATLAAFMGTVLGYLFGRSTH